VELDPEHNNLQLELDHLPDQDLSLDPDHLSLDPDQDLSLDPEVLQELNKPDQDQEVDHQVDHSSPPLKMIHQKHSIPKKDLASNPQLHSLALTLEPKPSHLLELEEHKPSHLLELEEHKLSLAWPLMMLLVLVLLQEEEHSKAKLLLTLLN